MDNFRRLMSTVLSETASRNWIGVRYENITNKMIDDFLRYTENPSRGLEALEKAGKDARVLREDGNPIFNRSLAYQIADLYGSKDSNDMKSLIQSVFAGVFCKREGASGRYDDKISEIIEYSEEDIDCDEFLKERIIVYANEDVKVPLPRIGKMEKIDQTFGEILSEVRNSDNCKELRRKLQSPTENTSINKIVDDWRSVASELSEKVINKEFVNIRTSLIGIGESLFTGTMVSVATGLKTGSWEIPAILESLVLGGTVAAGWEPVKRILGYLKEKPEIRKEIENMVKFRCVKPKRLLSGGEIGVVPR